ncbi:MAG: uroporphyrinogen decarboxylase family protein [Chloroflexi bacterium]|nr:uroporphyrinogen decarboxylase family protein [Chloroflexota bacterium]
MSIVNLTPRQRFIAALEHKPLEGRVPHFELVFYLTMEAFGKVHPTQRYYAQWDQMSESERHLHRSEIADIYIMTAERYEHSAIFIHQNPNTFDEICRTIDLIREKSGDKYFLMMHGDATYSVPNGKEMEKWSAWLYDDIARAKRKADRMVNEQLKFAERLARHGGLDGFALCSDYCFNTAPFLRPSMFSEVVTPYLCKLVAGQKALGYYVIKHTDGNIMPILDDLAQAKPHALHSIDPQAGVDIAVVKRRIGKEIALIGNVNCGLLQSGTDEEVTANVRYALQNGMPGGGYIFSTSNCVYTGLPLKRYEMMLDIWRREGNYPPTSS